MKFHSFFSLLNKPPLPAILSCFVWAYLLAVVNSESLVLNTDSLAPVLQVKVVASGLDSNVFGLHLARIPSFFPDLFLLYLIQLFGPKNTPLEAIGYFALFQGWLLLMAATWFLRIASNKHINTLFISCVLGSISLSISAWSSPFRQAVGTILTPVHHGGNITMTLLYACLFLPVISRQVGSNHSTRPWTRTLLIGIIVMLGVASNKLFLFTAIIPSLLLLCAAWIFSSGSRHYQACPSSATINSWKALQLFAVIGTSLVVGMNLSSLFNVQCPGPINLAVGLMAMPSLASYIILNYPMPILGLLLSILGLILSINLYYSECGLTTQNLPVFSRLSGSLSPVSQCFQDAWRNAYAFIALSSFSFLLYAPFLLGVDFVAQSEDFPIRYFLVTIVAMPLLIAMLLIALLSWLFINRRTDFFNKKTLSIATLGTLFSLNHFISLDQVRAKSSKSVFPTISLTHAEDKRPYIQPLMKLAQKYGLRYGISDFWGAEPDLFSNGELLIVPVLNNGKPDFWAFSPHYFLAPNRKISRDFNFIYSTSPEFSGKMIEAYGKPSKIFYFDEASSSFRESTSAHQQGKYVMLYSDPSIIASRIKDKANSFRRECDRSGGGFIER